MKEEEKGIMKNDYKIIINDVLKVLERRIKKTFDSDKNPLLVSCRLGKEKKKEERS